MCVRGRERQRQREGDDQVTGHWQDEKDAWKSTSMGVRCSVMSDSATVALRAPLPMGFPRQECWSGLPFPSPGDLPVIWRHHRMFIHSSLDGLWELLPPFGYCEWCNCEHGCSLICLNPVFHFLLYLPKKKK